MKFIFFILLFFFMPIFCWAKGFDNEIVYQLKDQDAVYVLHYQNKQETQKALVLWQKNPALEIVEPNYERQILASVNDPYFNYQWHLHQANDIDIDIEKAWSYSTGDAQTVVAVIDTGIDIDHPDLAVNIWVNEDEIEGNGIDDDDNGYIDDRNGWDFVNNNKDVNPDPDGQDSDSGVVHGTHLAGIIAAAGNNGEGGVGVCLHCRIMPVQVLDDEGKGSVSQIYNGIQYAVANGADVINLSFGSYDFSAAEKKAVAAAQAKNILVIAAAGNDNKNLNKKKIYPACQKDVLGVAAIDDSGQKADFSNFGSDCVDIAAPGKNIFSTYYFDNDIFRPAYGNMSGTSMAAPIVAGVAGLVKSYIPGLSGKQIAKYILKSKEALELDVSMGSGKVNAKKSLSKASNYLRPQNPKKIFTYSGKKKKHQLQESVAVKSQLPYFEWSKGKTKVGAITGYWVYWGKNKNADPVLLGQWQTKQNYLVKKKNKIISNKKTYYYLIIKAQNSLGKKANKIVKWQYQYDNHLD